MSRYFANPLYGGQDPFVCKGPDGMYYGVAESCDSRQIEVFCSPRLTDRGIRRIAFTAFESGPCSHDLWAPEIWYLRGKWYIYFAGASGAGMANWSTHRMYVLEAEQPMGPYRFLGELDLGEHMSIDGTVLELPSGELIFVYMRKHEGENTLFMAPMSDPAHISGKPVLLSKPDYPWEADINEGAFPIVRNGQVYLMYSANAAHLPQYCIALLHCLDPNDALNPKVWVKEQRPILVGTEDVIGPGHACIVPSPDGSEDYLVFHSKFDRTDTLPEGWNRVVNILRLKWDSFQRPIFEPLPRRGELRRLPAGEKPLEWGYVLRLRPGQEPDALAEYGSYRTRIFFYEEEGLRICGTRYPEYGNKAMVRACQWRDLEVTCRMKAEKGKSGLLFRVRHPAAGAMLWNGCGLFLEGNRWELVRCDSRSIKVLARGTHTERGAVSLRVIAVGIDVTVLLNDRMICRLQVPDIPETGQLGFGTLNGDGMFCSLNVRPL